MSYTLAESNADHNLSLNQEKRLLLAKMRPYELREARRASAATQKQLAERMGVSQKRISVLESGSLERTQIRTLERYIEAIGGKLRISAELPNGESIQLI